MSGCSGIPPLLGHTVAVTGHRRSDELAAHLLALGAEVLQGSTMHARPVSDDDGMLRSATQSVLGRPPDFLLATTGIGVRGWINAAAAWRAREDLLRALASTRILARGPKVVGSLTEAGLDVWFTAESGRTASMVEHLLGHELDGAHVALQLPGDPMDDVVATLEGAGAHVTVVPVYEWTWPDDVEPARRVLRSVAAGRVSAVTFTSRPAVRHLLALARRDGLDDDVSAAFRRSVLAICIGPTTADELRVLTGAASSCPERALLGELAPVVADEVRARFHHHVRMPNGDDIVVQGRLVEGNGQRVTTSDREAALLHRLIGPPGRTVSRADLLRSVWHSEVVAPSVLDATVARLRRRLQGTGLAIHTIPARGYLVMGEVERCQQELAAVVSC